MLISNQARNFLSLFYECMFLSLTQGISGVHIELKPRIGFVTIIKVRVKEADIIPLIQTLDGLSTAL